MPGSLTFPENQILFYQCCQRCFDGHLAFVENLRHCFNGTLITRPKETYDGALPSGNSVMAYCLVRLSLLDAGKGYEEEAERQLAFLSGEAQGYPAGYGLFQTALLMYLNPPEKITVVLSGEKPGEILAQLPLYADVRMLPEATDDYHLLNGRTTYYVCKNHTCLPPSNEWPGR